MYLDWRSACHALSQMPLLATVTDATPQEQNMSASSVASAVKQQAFITLFAPQGSLLLRLW